MKKYLFFLLIIIGLGAVVWGIYNNYKVALSKDGQQIRAWIEKNDLNKYGDPKNTVYSNKNPLCKDKGKCINRYEYIKEMNPDHPWTK